MRMLLLGLSRILARYELWSLTALVLSRAGRIAALPQAARGRLHYALLMSYRRPLTRTIFRRNSLSQRDTSAEANFALAAMAQRFNRLRLATALYRRTLRLEQLPHQAALARVMADLVPRLADGSIQGTISRLIDGLDLVPQQRLVVVAADCRFLDLYYLWRAQASGRVTGRIVGLALDRASAEVFAATLETASLDLSRWFVFEPDPAGGPPRLHERSRNMLWIFTVLIVRELVARGHSVLSIDLDAIPLGDLDEMLDSFPDADIVAQQDVSLPLDVARRFGFIVCCGFMAMRSNLAVRDFLDRYVAHTIQEMDDQLALNHMIFDAGIHSMQRTRTYLSFTSCGVRWLCPDTSLVSRDSAYGSVIRHFQQRGQSIDELRRELGLDGTKPQTAGPTRLSPLSQESCRSLSGVSPPQPPQSLS